MLVISTFLVLTVLTAEPAQSRKPVIDSPIVADPYNMPSTLEGLIDRADAVVIARIKRARDVSAQQARTDYEIQLVETIKAHQELTASPVVCRAIGTVEKPNRIVRVFQPNFPGFQPGAEYLLFLGWDETKRCFYPDFGAAGSALMDGVDGLKPFVPHPAIGALKGFQRADAVRSLNAARKLR